MNPGNFVTGLSAPGTLALRVETPVDVETPAVAYHGCRAEYLAFTGNISSRWGAVNAQPEDHSWRSGSRVSVHCAV